MLSGLFVSEGSSDAPLADLVTTLFETRGVTVQLTKPDFALLNERVARDVASRVEAGHRLMEGRAVELLVVHRDVDNTTSSYRLKELQEALQAVGVEVPLVPILPVRMTEAWLLLDEGAIRTVAGNPRGRRDLALTRVHELERLADPKARLREALLAAADVRGRRRTRLDQRFERNRRQLLERLDPAGPINQLPSWAALLGDVDQVVRLLVP